MDTDKQIKLRSNDLIDSSYNSVWLLSFVVHLVVLYFAYMLHDL